MLFLWAGYVSNFDVNPDRLTQQHVASGSGSRTPTHLPSTSRRPIPVADSWTGRAPQATSAPSLAARARQDPSILAATAHAVQRVSGASPPRAVAAVPAAIQFRQWLLLTSQWTPTNLPSSCR
ncbi:hypothetical protein C8Q73DRAFT_362241 [Cubamyces lactineus]|nr:hypothetical protein C8Q73DRAFT_362241 [Cubamyces lactineus]